ncbi:hypothetical protein CTheo_6173 [Ceratobasidium theobromae]|uniref:Uncharacterized protein n=1 Tax=Ceratobasidium theobromae TaxID=1582974 RepID=A0A5N5QF43_9AGAM|nr:hypothetical protein CTheo_6173 [Ceratobasidium theobromae]
MTVAAALPPAGEAPLAAPHFLPMIAVALIAVAKFAAAAVCAFRAAVTSPMSALVPAPTAEAAAIFVKGIAIEGIDPVARRVVASKEVAGILWDRLRESRGHRKESEEEEKEYLRELELDAEELGSGRECFILQALWLVRKQLTQFSKWASVYGHALSGLATIHGEFDLEVSMLSSRDGWALIGIVIDR